MAVLAKIRQRSALMIGVIALALFAFIIQDVLTRGSFGRNSKDVGTVNGKNIPFEDFRIKVNNMEKGEQNLSPTAAVNTVWDREVTIAVLSTEFDKLGLRVGDKHLIEILKEDPSIGNNPLFKNGLGTFDVTKFKNYFASNPEAKQYLKEREKEAELNAKYQIYSNLIKSAMYTTESEAKLDYELENNKVSFSYVAGLFSTIKESDVKISDSDILDYMKKNKKKYKAEETRTIDYVLIEDKASPEDEKEAKQKVSQLLGERIVYNSSTRKNDTLPGFKKAKNTVEFVNSNSDIPYDSSYVSQKNLPALDAEKLYNLPTGEVYGPYLNKNYYCISKSLGRKSGVNVRASHILISYEGTQVPNKKQKRTKAEAKATAERILAQIKANPNDFTIQAYATSDDSSSQQGGDLGFFGPNQMVKPFNDFVFKNPIGAIGLVETQFGFHIIKVTDKQDGIRLATIAQKIEPSETTSDKSFVDATQFEMKVADADFNKTAKDMKLQVVPSINLKSMDETVGALGNQRSIVRWVFEDDTKKEAVKRFEISNVGHLIVKVSKIYDSGYTPIDMARFQIQPILQKIKKTAIIKAKIKGNSLDDIAKSIGSQIQEATEITLKNPVFGLMGAEGKVVGNAFVLDANKISMPIEGNAGVFVVKNKASIKALPQTNYETYISQRKGQKEISLNRAFFALKDIAEIEDNRKSFGF